MSFFPKPNKDKPAHNFPAGSEQAVAADLLMDLVKLAHQQFKAIVAKDEDATEKATQVLVDKVQSLDMNNKIHRTAITSLVMTVATQIPPTAYGDDYNKWPGAEDIRPDDY